MLSTTKDARPIQRERSLHAKAVQSLTQSTSRHRTCAAALYRLPRVGRKASVARGSTSGGLYRRRQAPCPRDISKLLVRFVADAPQVLSASAPPSLHGALSRRRARESCNATQRLVGCGPALVDDEAKGDLSSLGASDDRPPVPPRTRHRPRHAITVAEFALAIRDVSPTHQRHQGRKREPCTSEKQ
ncbi:hypothetical protein MTO96_016776 [Rhipicephalus appendiculatus]